LFLKENMVKKHSRMERQLSEEQMQDVTGGCSTCVGKLGQAIEHQNKYTSYSTKVTNLIKQAQDAPPQDRPHLALLTTANLVNANYHQEQRDKILNEVQATGHLPALRRALGPLSHQE
jgi:hypothetical protein